MLKIKHWYILVLLTVACANLPCVSMAENNDAVILPAGKQSNLLSNGSFENKLTNWNYGSVM